MPADVFAVYPSRQRVLRTADVKHGVLVFCNVRNNEFSVICKRAHGIRKSHIRAISPLRITLKSIKGIPGKLSMQGGRTHSVKLVLPICGYGKFRFAGGIALIVENRRFFLGEIWRVRYIIKIPNSV